MVSTGASTRWPCPACIFSEMPAEVVLKVWDAL